MTKKETIWRNILHEALTRRTDVFTQKNIAKQFHYSTSTVYNALKIPRELGAIEVTGRFFRLRDVEKFLLIWATQRHLTKDIIYQTYVDMNPQKIEGSMPPNTIFAAFSAYRLKYKESPADYDTIYVYSKNLEEIKQRFPKEKNRKKNANLFVLKPDEFLNDFGSITPDVQTFVDLWNLPQWYAKDFLEALKKKIL